MQKDSSKIKILITGGSGFIGRNLKEYLQDNYQIFAPTHQELDLLDSARVRDYVKKNTIDIIIHSAVVGERKNDIGSKSNFKTNLRMFFNIVRCKDLVAKIINFGSGAEYDKSRALVNVKEEDFEKRIPIDDYGFYKYVCSKYILNSEKITTLRLFGVYGKHENYLFKFISNVIVKNLLKMPIEIGQNVYFDYLYIDDLVKIVGYFIEHDAKFRDYNVVSGEVVDLIEIVKIINKISDYKSRIIIKNKGLNLEYTADNSRLRRVIPNLMITPIDEGIRKLYRWYKIHLQEIDKEKVKEDHYLKHININNA